MHICPLTLILSKFEARSKDTKKTSPWTENATKLSFLCGPIFGKYRTSGLALQLSSDILSGFFYGNIFVTLKNCHSFL